MAFDIFKLLSSSVLISSLKYFMISQCFFTIGVLCIKSSNNIIKIKKVNYNKDALIFQTGLICFAIGIVPLLYTDIVQFYNYINMGGYLATYNTGINGIVFIGNIHTHYLAKCIWTPDHHTCMSLRDISFQNHGH